MNDPIERDFRRFHEARPSVYARIVRLARMDKGAQELQGGGKVRGSIAEIIETLRRQGVSIDNDYRSRYARLIMEQEPDLAGFFEVRGLRARIQPKVAA